jgi:heat shock protein HtpX
MFNMLKTAVLMAAITALFMAIGSLLGAAGNDAGADRCARHEFLQLLVLRQAGPQDVQRAGGRRDLRAAVPSDDPGAAQRAALPMPRVYIIEEDAPNAFATGRNPEHAAVAATTGIMRVLTERELRGVMAHELAHVRHRDILISTVSATMAGAISMLANFAMFFGGRDSEGRPANPIAGIAVAILAPIAAGLIQMAISRAREFEADRGGAENFRRAARASHRPWRRSTATPRACLWKPRSATPRLAQMMIINPLSGGGLRGSVLDPSVDRGAGRAVCSRWRRRAPADGRLTLIQVGGLGADIDGSHRSTAMRRLAVLLATPIAVLLAGCDALGIESAEKIAAAARPMGVRSAALAGTPRGPSRIATPSTARRIARRSLPAGAT